MSTAVRPLFTVICPTYNRGPALLETIRSVQEQTFGSWELIVASDASSDDTDDIVRAVAAEDPRVRLLRTRRFGAPAGPTNAALAEATGEVIAYIDHDDHWLPRHLEVLAGAFADGADLAGTRSRTRHVDGSVFSETELVALCWHPDLQLLAPILHNSCAAHRRELAELVGGWREGADGLEDWDLWVRMSPHVRRCVTFSEVTVELERSSTSRQSSLALPFVHTIAAFPDWLSARACLKAIFRPPHADTLLDAAVQDIVDMHLRYYDDGSLVVPRGWSPSREELAAAVRTHTVDRVDQGIRPSVRRNGDLHEVVLPIGVMDAEHAARFSSTYRNVMRRETDLISRLFPAAVVPA